MQGNATEIDERNLLQLDALLSHGYGLSPQLVMRSKGLSIEAKALYGYLSSFAGAGDTAFPSTSRILEELDISKNRFYKIRKELISWGFISIETTATSAGLRTVYTLPQNPIAIKTEIDEIASRRNEIKSSLVANLHNEDTVSHKGDSESEHLQQSAGNEPCRQSEAKAQNRGSNLKPCLQSEDEGCLQSGDKLYIDTNINPKVSIDRSAAHPSDDEGPSDWKVTEGMTDPTQRDDGESDRDANRRDALDAVPDGTYDPLPTVADGYTLSNSEFEAFNHLCSLSIKTVRGAVRNEAAKQYAKRLGEGYSPATIEKAYIFGLISKFAEGQDTAFVVQKVNFSGTKQIGDPEYELLPLGPTSGEDLADFTEWFMDDFKSGIDFGCDENREHLAMLAHTGFYREGEYVDQLLTFHQLDFSNAHAVTEKFSFEGRPESNEFIGDLDQLPKSPEEYRTATEQSFDGNKWVNFRFSPDLVDLSKSIDPDTARTDYRADVTSEIAGRNCSFTLHLAKWQYDKAVKAQNQNSPIHIGMKLKYIKGGVIPVQFEGEQFTHNYSPKKLEESLPKVQKARSVSGCRQGKGNRVSSYQDRSYRFKTEEVCERGLPRAHESRN